MKINKTDDNDAEGLAHLVRSGWYREVRVKSREAMLARSLLGARTQLLGIVTDLSNQIRGLMKTLVVPKGAGTVFEANVRRLLEDEAAVAAIVLPLLPPIGIEAIEQNFAWDNIVIFGLVGLIGVWLSERTGFMPALDARVSNRQRYLWPVLAGGAIGVLASVISSWTLLRSNVLELARR